MMTRFSQRITDNLKRAGSAGVLAVALLGWSAAADAGTIPLNIFITGNSPPTGSVTITDIGDEVRFDFNISDGDLHRLYFNLVPEFDFDDVSISLISTSPDSPTLTLLDGPQAPSNLDFDLGVDFGTGQGSGVVTSGSFVLAIAGLDLSQPSFYQTSTNPGGTTVTVAAHIQSLGDNEEDSATIGGNPGGGTGGEVPEPAAIGLFGLGLLGLGALRRRRTA